MSTVLVTGGAGFMGSAPVRMIVERTDHIVVDADKLTCAGRLQSLDSVSGSARYRLEHVDVCDA